MGKQVVFYANREILASISETAEVRGLIFVQREWTEGQPARLIVYPELDIDAILSEKVFRPLLLVHHKTELPSSHRDVLAFTHNKLGYIELTLFFGKSKGYDSRIWFQTPNHKLEKEANALLRQVRKAIKASQAAADCKVLTT